MPQAVQHVTLLDPLRYFLVIVRGLFLEGRHARRPGASTVADGADRTGEPVSRRAGCSGAACTSCNSTISAVSHSLRMAGAPGPDAASLSMEGLSYPIVGS